MIVSRKYCYQEDEFEINIVREHARTAKVRPLAGYLTITYKITGVPMEYKWGLPSTWIREFEEDLECGAFEVHNPT